MNSCRRLHTICLGVLALFASSGCVERTYRSEATLRADGSVDRAIYQERSETPAEAMRPGVWAKATYAARIEPKKWIGPISALPLQAADQEHPYFAAWGHFEHPSKLPTHFLQKAPEGIADGRLALECTRVDYGFAVEHHWRETLTDVVTLDDMHLARAELVELLIGLGRDALADAYGADYDFTGLEKWFRTEGTLWFSEATDLLYDLGVRRELNRGDQWELAFAKICQRHGLDLFDPEGNLLPADARDAVLQHFVRNVLRKNIRRPDGSPVAGEEADINAFLRRFTNHGPEDPDVDEGAESQPSPLDLSWKKIIKKRVGGEAAFEARTSPLAKRIVGLYIELFGAPRRFYYRLAMPGTIVETTGKLLSPQEVEWTFDASDAFPLGYAMNCRSLAPQPDAQKRLLGGEPLRTQESLDRYVALLSVDRELNGAVQECIAKKSLSALYAYRKVVRTNADAQPAQRVVHLFQMLQLPAEEPKKADPSPKARPAP